MFRLELRITVIVALCCCATLAGCSDDGNEVIDAAVGLDAPLVVDAPVPDAVPIADAFAAGALEIGIRGEGDTFIPLQSGQDVPVVLGAIGLDMLVLSLRAYDVAAGAIDPSIEFVVSDTVYAVDILGPIKPSLIGNAHMLWDIRVPYMVALCCYNCGEGTITATFTDSSAQLFARSVTVRPSRGGCPDPAACCVSADACPVPSKATVCE